MLMVLFALQLSIVLGMGLTVVLGLAMRFGAGIFTSDMPMIQVIHRGIPVRTWPGLAIETTPLHMQAFRKIQTLN